MAYKYRGHTEVRIFKNAQNENCIRLEDIIKWLKDQQNLNKENQLLHLMIRSIIKINNKHK
jgi:hypothetical protein